ncbi:d-galactonate transporter [Enterobacter cloacae]|uniref:D-galactonate transporter n=1 Tax=Enterobacter cloacae TaxID=550 RepID=A0A377LRT7_ENTCL|nr:d-galactonate transporter [Enterobacter cloacae]
MNLIVSRKMVVTMGALLMIGPGMIGLFTSPYVAIALLCIGGFAHQSLSGALITLSSDVFGRNEVATANGLTGMAAWTASTLFALVVGALADTIGFSPLFAVLAIFDLMGGSRYLDGAEKQICRRTGERVPRGTGDAELALLCRVALRLPEL